MVLGKPVENFQAIMQIEPFLSNLLPWSLLLFSSFVSFPRDFHHVHASDHKFRLAKNILQLYIHRRCMHTHRDRHTGIHIFLSIFHVLKIACHWIDVTFLNAPSTWIIRKRWGAQDGDWWGREGEKKMEKGECRWFLCFEYAKCYVCILLGRTQFNYFVRERNCRAYENGYYGIP